MKTHNIQVAIKVVFFAACLFLAFGGHHPPVIAQSRESATDQVQDEQIRETNTHIASSDKSNSDRMDKSDVRVNKEWDAINANTQAIAGFQTEERVIGSVLGILSASGLFIQIRKKPA